MRNSENIENNLYPMIELLSDDSLEALLFIIDYMKSKTTKSIS